LTYLWKKSRSDKYYYIQTTEPPVSKQIRKIPGILLISYSINSFNEIYRLPVTNIKDGKKLLQGVTCQQIYPVKGGFMAKTQLTMEFEEC